MAFKMAFPAEPEMTEADRDSLNRWSLSKMWESCEELQEEAEVWSFLLSAVEQMLRVGFEQYPDSTKRLALWTIHNGLMDVRTEMTGLLEQLKERTMAADELS